MKTTLREYTVREIVDGFVYNELEGKGLFGLGGKLTIQPEYQRSYIYAKENLDTGVIHSLFKGYPLGLVYFNQIADNKLEVLDGQQRITSFGRYITDKFAVKDASGLEQYFTGLPQEKQEQILDTTILVYECDGSEQEIKEWFQTINIAGLPLNHQELLNAVYSGPFVTAGREEFSNSNNANIQKWQHYVTGSAHRQDYWERALEWVSKDKTKVPKYLSLHRNDTDIQEVKTYFTSVIDWAASVFSDIEKEMKGLEWGRLYEAYHNSAYNPADVSQRVKALYADPYVKRRRGVFEYILGGETDATLLEVRLFDDATKRATYSQQTSAAQTSGTSNCSHCGLKDATKTKIWQFADMDADHITAWTKDGPTTAANCEMLCKTHNRAKGNK